jgi:RNA polymerase sigma-70 factor (ECF subfamily)
MHNPLVYAAGDVTGREWSWRPCAFLDLAPPADSDSNPAARELARSMRQMIRCLPEKYQQALLLTEFEGLKQHELAEHLGLSLSGAKSRVQRAREKLKATLLDCCHVELDRLGQVLSYTPNCAACAGDDRQGAANCGPEDQKKALSKL